MAPRARLARLGGHLQPPAVAQPPPVVASPNSGSLDPLEITNVRCYTVGTRSDGQQLMVGNGRALIIVKVETADGHTGWGEAGLLGRELAVAGAVDHYRQFLIGSDARRIGALWQVRSGNSEMIRLFQDKRAFLSTTIAKTMAAGDVPISVL